MTTLTSAKPGSIRKLNHRHEQILNWLLTNPNRRLVDCAREFGYHKQTVYLIVGSDLFQHVYKMKCDELGEVAVHTMQDRLTGVGMQVLEKIEEKLETGASDRLLIDSSRTILDALGYGTRSAARSDPGPNQHLHIHVSATDLAAARSAAADRFRGQSSLRLVEPPSGDSTMEIETGPIGPYPLTEAGTPSATDVLDSA